jgi:hypothetical protein
MCIQQQIITDIMQEVVARWEIDDKITGLTDEMEKGA